MTQKWKFTVKDPEHTLKYEVVDGSENTIDVTEGGLDEIFTSIPNMQTLLGLTPKIAALMKVNTINKLEVEEENI